MPSVTVKLNRLRQSPRKIRLVADTVRRKPVAQAMDELAHLPQRAAQPLAKLLKAGMAAATQKNLANEKLIISELRVDEGTRLKRWLPAPRGRSYRIRKPTSHITLVISDEASNKKQVTGNKKQAKS